MNNDSYLGSFEASSQKFMERLNKIVSDSKEFETQNFSEGAARQEFQANGQASVEAQQAENATSREDAQTRLDAATQDVAALQAELEGIQNGTDPRVIATPEGPQRDTFVEIMTAGLQQRIEDRNLAIDNLNAEIASLNAMDQSAQEEANNANREFESNYEAQEVAYRDEIRQAIAEMKEDLNEITEVEGITRDDTDLIKEEIQLRQRQIDRELRKANEANGKLPAGDPRHVYYGDLIVRLNQQNASLTALNENIDKFMEIFNDLDDKHNRLNRYVDVVYDERQLADMAEAMEEVQKNMNSLSTVERTAPVEDAPQNTQGEPTPEPTVEPTLAQEPTPEPTAVEQDPVEPTVVPEAEPVQEGVKVDIPRSTEIRWASGLSEEQILDALERGIDEPRGPE